MQNLKLPICPRCNETKFVVKNESARTQECKQCEFVWKYLPNDIVGRAGIVDGLEEPVVGKWWNLEHKARQ